MEANEEAEEEVVRLAATAHFQQKRANVYFCAPILSPLHRLDSVGDVLALLFIVRLVELAAPSAAA